MAEQELHRERANQDGANSQHDNPTAVLAHFLVDLIGHDHSELPRLRRLATAAVLDTIGAIMYGSTQEWTLAAHRYAQATGGSGPCTVIGNSAAGTTPAMAAFANGSAAHAFELDDVHEEAISHPGAVVVPAALALAEHLGASGRDLLNAVVVGYEAMGRAGIAVGPASHMLAGFHPTSMSGVFGAAAAAASLLGLDGVGLGQSLGVASTLASGTMEFAASGGMNKRIHAGRAAEGGVLAATLVAEGFEGPADGLAGRYGFCRIFTDAPRIELLTNELGTRWMADEITVKPYAACSDIHPMIQAAAELTAEHGLTADQIVDIVADGPTKAATQNNMDGTTSVMAAQYSAQFNIAAAILADPTDPATYHPDAITRPDLAALQAKVSAVNAAEEFDATYAWKMGGRVSVTLTDGSRLSKTVHGQLGSMHDPLSTEALTDKFTKMTGSVGSEAQTAALLSAVMDLEGDDSVGNLSDALGAFGR